MTTALNQLPDDFVAMDLVEIESAGQQHFMLDSEIEAIVCDALVAIAESAKNAPFFERERAQLRKARF